jgi:DNA polymerase I
MNSLIYGKSQLDRIVSLEVGDDTAEIFRELEDGTISRETVPASHFILFNEKLSPKMKRLEGNQFYRYMIEYDSKEKHQEVLSASYKKKYKLFNVRDPKEAVMIKDGYTSFKGMRVQDVSVLSFDIEDTYGIGTKLKQDGKVLLIANTFRKQGKITKKQFAYDDYETEAEMLEAWCNWVRKIDPSILIGHNVYGHDLKVLKFAADKAEIKLALGRDGSNVRVSQRTSAFRKDGSQSYDYNNILVYGREVVDTWFLAMKYDGAARREYESYGLKAVIAHEGLEKKNRQHYDASTIAENYQKPEEWKKIKAYNVDDADDPLAYFDLTIPSFFYYAQSIPRSFQSVINSATGSQINSLLVRSYLQQGHSIALGSDKEEFEGAISLGIPGIHKNVFKIDVASLYPSIMLQHKIFPADKDPNGHIVEILDWFTKERLINKKKGKESGDAYFTALADSQKIVCNSFFGFMGAPKLNYNYPNGASQITKHGRRILQEAIVWATGKEYESP